MRIFKSKSKSKDRFEKKVDEALELSADTKEKLLEIKKGMEGFSEKKIEDTLVIEKIINSWYIIHAVLENNEIDKLMFKDDYESIRNNLFPAKFGAAIEEDAGVNTEMDLYDATSAAISLLLKDGSKSLQGLDDIINISRSVDVGSKERISGVNTPGIIISIDEEENIVSVSGADNISESIVFLEKAIKRGEMNKDKSNESLDNRYKSKSYLYKKYRDLSLINNLKHEVISFEPPMGVKGRAIILQIVKDNPKAFYDVDEFYKQPKSIK